MKFNAPLSGVVVACHFVVTLVAATNASVTEGTPEVDIPLFGRVKGSVTISQWKKRTIYQFRGIPFARPPIGELRFKPPEAALPWYETLDATKFNRRCPTSSADSTDEPSDALDTGALEDCLHINVYTPQSCKLQLGTNNASGFPVLFYIHGGSFRVGSARDFRPEFLVDRDVVLVVPQYRLGPLGFLSLQTEDIPGNVGLLDILLALHWVKDHIHLFGGDPSKVTILGQSAGGAAVTLLMVSPRVQEGLFTRVIAQSGTAFGTWVMDPDPVTHARSIANTANCSHRDLSQLAQCLRNVNAHDLLNAHSNFLVGRENGWTLLKKEKKLEEYLLIFNERAASAIIMALGGENCIIGMFVLFVVNVNYGLDKTRYKLYIGAIVKQPISAKFDLSFLPPTSAAERQQSLLAFHQYSDLKRGGRGTGGNHVVIQSEAVGEANMFLREDPGISLKEGRFIRVPLMGGITKHEGSFILGSIEDPTGLVVQTLTEKYFGHGELGNFSKMTPGLVDDGVEGGACAGLHGVLSVLPTPQICGVSLLKASAFRTVLENSRVQPSYLYSFNYDGQFTMFGYGEEVDYPFPGGVAHSDDLIYLFPHHDKNLSDAELAVANTMVDLWTNFAATGSPAPAAGVESWPPVSGERGPYLRIDRKSTVRENFLDEYVIAVTDGFQFSSSSTSFRSLYPLFTIAICCVVHLLP
uniref:Carboxylic ester hydrolase n=1 Tax=Timema shepardi TaxID=629360 RepID=A0A7R9APB6_TIMSH|nr:unnamed protein product [Timema shepardi]